MRNAASAAVTPGGLVVAAEDLPASHGMMALGGMRHATPLPYPWDEPERWVSLYEPRRAAC